jgi:hypothetical protein
LNCPLCNHTLLDGGAAGARIVPEKTETWGPAHYWCARCQLPFAKERVEKLAAGAWPFRERDLVHVEGSVGEVVGQVLHASTPYDMPDLGPGSASHEAHQLMHEWRVDFLLLIRHRHGEDTICFFALRNTHGWCDLKGQSLEITKVRR